MIAGTRLYHLGVHTPLGAAAELTLIVASIIALIANWRKGLVLAALTAAYFAVYLFYGPF